MDYLLKKKRERIEAEAEELFGNDTVLKTAFIMSKIPCSQEETEEVIKLLQQENNEIIAEIEAKMQYTFDASGNVVPIKPQEEQDNIQIKISD